MNKIEKLEEELRFLIEKAEDAAENSDIDNVAKELGMTRKELLKYALWRFKHEITYSESVLSMRYAEKSHCVLQKAKKALNTLGVKSFYKIYLYSSIYTFEPKMGSFFIRVDGQQESAAFNQLFEGNTYPYLSDMFCAELSEKKDCFLLSYDASEDSSMNEMYESLNAIEVWIKDLVKLEKVAFDAIKVFC